MYLMYVDESGDPGLNLAGGATPYFALTGLVVHELRWHAYLDQLIDFRRRMKQLYGFGVREELHAAQLINKPGPLNVIPRNNRLSIIRAGADELASMTDMNIISVLVDKTTKAVGQDVFDMAWRTLIQRFENTLSRRNFVGPSNPDERGMLFCDHTDDKKLKALLRSMRRYNPVPNQAAYGLGYRNLRVKSIIEDCNFRDSRDSFFVQAADLAAFLLYQYHAPSSYMKKTAGYLYFERLDPILCKVASSNDPRGIVRL